MFPRLEAVPSLRAEMQSWDKRRTSKRVQQEDGNRSRLANKPPGVLVHHQRILDLINKDLESEVNLKHMEESTCILHSLEHMQCLSICFADFVKEANPATAQTLGRVHSGLLCAFEKTLQGVLDLASLRVSRRGMEAERLKHRIEESEVKCSQILFELDRERRLSKAKDEVLKSHRKRASIMEFEIHRLESIIRQGATLLATKTSAADTKVASCALVSRSLMGKVDGLSYLLDRFRVQEKEEGVVLNQMGQLLLMVRAKAQLGHFARQKIYLPAIAARPHDVEPIKMVLQEKEQPVRHLKTRSTMTKESIFPVCRSFGGVEESVYVSGPVTRSTLWWKAFNFARCSKCQTCISDKRNSNETVGGSLDDEVGKAENNQTDEANFDFDNSSVAEISVSRIRSMFQSSEGGTNFLLPVDFAKFLIHLPESVLHMGSRPLHWLLEEIEGIYTLKYNADLSDRKDGVRLQSLGSFLIEHFLFKYDLRRLAEVRIYELLRATFAHQKSEEVVLFAQFLGAVPFEPDKSTELLENDVLQVILHVRHLLISTALSQDGGSLAKHEGLAYVTLDLAIAATKHILQQFLSPRKLSIQCRVLENLSSIETTMINAKGEKTVKLETERSVSTGSRMTVRLKMRNAMVKRRAQNAAKEACQEKGRNETKEDESGDKTRAMVRLHDVLKSMVKILQMRKKVVRTKLQHAFIAGDEDGNGVLSFSEFESILSKLNPDMSQRQCLRLFRSAVTEHAANNSLSITPQAFEEVCKSYDVLPLVDFRTLSPSES